MKIKIYILFLLFILLSSELNFGQIDSSQINQNKMMLSPSFVGIQIEAITSIATSEVGGLLDYDIFSSPNKKHNIGFRLSTEYYDHASLDVGGKSAPGPFWDFNIYARHSIRGKHFWFSPLLGLGMHKSFEEDSAGINILVKWGLELKYNIFKDNFGLILKFASSFNGDAGYGGIGFAFSFYK